jgi:hypothetical protein
MIPFDQLAAAWRDERARRLSRYARSPQFDDDGLTLGPMVVVTKRAADRWGAPILEIDGCEKRILSLLAVAYWRPIRPIVIDQLMRASKALGGRNPALAPILIAQSGLGRIDEDERTAFRLFAAEKLLDAGVDSHDLMKGLGLDPWPLDAIAVYNPKQPRVPKDDPSRTGGRWVGENGPSARHNGGPPLDEKPKFPELRPDNGEVRSALIKAGVKWLLRIGLTAADITAPEVVIPIQLGIEVGSWAYPYIKAYFDNPKSLQELRDAVNDPQPGYDTHHIVEQTPAEKDKFTRDQIDAPDNVVEIPQLKHWDLNRWYEKKNPDYGYQTPRQYVRDKDWAERYRVGLEGLRKVGVLAP